VTEIKKGTETSTKHDEEATPIKENSIKLEPMQKAFKSDENTILALFENDSVKEKIRTHLRNIIGGELSKMSNLLRDATRDWIAKEKKKYQAEIDQLKEKLVNEKLLEFQNQNQKLEVDKKNLERKLELKDHENNLIFESLKEMMHKKNK